MSKFLCVLSQCRVCVCVFGGGELWDYVRYDIRFILVVFFSCFWRGWFLAWGLGELGVLFVFLS